MMKFSITWSGATKFLFETSNLVKDGIKKIFENHLLLISKLSKMSKFLIIFKRF